MLDRAWRLRLVRGAAAIAAVAIALACPSPSAAQVALPSGVVAQAGELVRVRTAGWEYTGTLAHVVNDTAVVRFGGGITGSTIGLLAGGVGGGLWGAKKRYPRWMRGVLP